MSISAVHGVSTGCQGHAYLSAVGCGARLLAVYHVGSDGQYGHGRHAVTVGVVLSDLVHESLNDIHSKLVNSVIVIAVLGEITLNDVINNNISCYIYNVSCLILYLDILADRLYLSVLDSGK